MVSFAKKGYLLYFVLIVSIISSIFSFPAIGAENRSYEIKIQATIGEGSGSITIDADLSIPNLIGILEMDLMVEGETEHATVYVLRDRPGSKMKIPSALDMGFADGELCGSVKVKINKADRPIYTRDLYPSWFDYSSDFGFYYSYDSGEGFSNAERGEINYYYNGLHSARVFFTYTEETLDYEHVDDIIDAMMEDKLYSFWVGAEYILILSDEDIEYFLDKGELLAYSGFKWPGLYELLTANDIYKNFTSKNNYTPGQFADVTNQWYADSVKKVYELGLMKGKSDDKFDPEGTITIAEAIAMAARLHNICMSGSGEFTQGTPWYDVYVNYAIENGIIRNDDFRDYSLKATRAEMAYIFASAVPKTLVKINNVGSIPDVNENTKYHDSIFLLYRAGVLTGNDASGTFAPDTEITRAQAAAIITRIAIPSERKTLNY